MKDFVIKILTEESKLFLKESGIRDINKLAKRYPKAKIYFHQDLDGVTTALGMKNYLEQNGIEVVDSEIIQYGDKEFAIKKLDARGDVMPVLVDFAHGKPMFVIHTDHHDTQAGVEQGTATNFKSSRSNVETISQTVSPKDIFPTDDNTLISMVDSADYAKYNITPKQVMNYLFKIDKDQSLQRNKMVMGMVANKLLLAFKNKPGFLESIVMNANPSLLSILTNIKAQMKEKNYADVESLERNKESYVQSMKVNKDVKVSDNIIVQYGGGNMMKPGSYDRFTPFRNNPEADFLVLAWDLGLVQASCNPFKKERALKGVNLGEIKDEVLNKWKGQLQGKDIPLSTIKWVSESGKDFGEQSVGFTFKDFKALYGEKFKKMNDGDDILDKIEDIMKKPFNSLTYEEMKMLDSITVNAWDLIESNSGGHKCITNISGLSYLGRTTRPPQSKSRYGGNSDHEPHVKFTKMIQNEFVRVLQEKIEQEKVGTNDLNENSNIIRKKDLKPNPMKFSTLGSKKLKTPNVSKNDLMEQGTFNASNLGFMDFKSVLDKWKNKLKDATTSDEPTTISQEPISVSTGGGNANFRDITKKVIANFEGGYWNPICHGSKGMGKSTETMFGLDRYNGNIESTNEGKQFFKIIDDEKRSLGAKSTGDGKNTKWTNMDGFCQKWKYNYKGDSRTQKPLMDLATSIMEKRFNSYMSSSVKDPKVKEKIMNNKNLLTHMSYATWNGSGFFRRFAKRLEDKIKRGASDKELVDIAIQSRAETGLYNKDKIAKAIANPDSMKSA